MAVAYSERQMAATLDTPRRANRLLIALIWATLVLVAASYVFTFISIPAYYQLAIHGQVPTQSLAGETVLSQAMLEQGARLRGLSLPAYLIYDLVVNLVLAAGFWIAAGLVAWQARHDWYRWFAALMLAFFPSGYVEQISSAAYPVAARYASFMALLWPCLPLFIFLFPDGRAVPRWGRWPMAGFFGAHLSVQALGYLAGLPGSPLILPDGIFQVFSVILLVFPFLFICQGYRYLRAADAVTRKQIQWFVVALCLLALGTIVDIVTGSASKSSDHGYFSDLDNLWSLVLPAAITIAILRYRLWDIDLLIRRTLIYGVLTGLLALAYFGSVVVLQRLFQALTGQAQSQIVTVLSTLAIAALFVPLRRRVQSFIDRRFYRRKYDAARILADFGAAAREDVNLDDLTGRLVSVVDETIEPSSVAVWLASPRER